MFGLQKQPSLSVVVPAFNEEMRLGPTLDKVLSFCAGKFSPLEVIVVDDGSADRTSAVAEERAANGVRVLRNEPNRGKGFSVRRGVLEAQGDLVLMTDADLSTPIEEIEKLLLAMDGGSHEIAIGSRGLKASQIEVAQPAYRVAMGKTFNGLLRVLVGTPLRDTQCGFKLFTRDAARDLFSRSTIPGFAFDVEVLFLAERLGYRVAEVPVRWINSPASTVHPVRDSFRVFRDIFRLRWRHRRLAAQVPQGRGPSPRKI